MLTAHYRLTIYSGLCLLSFYLLAIQAVTDSSLVPLFGMVASTFGIWLESHSLQNISDKQQ